MFLFLRGFKAFALSGYPKMRGNTLRIYVSLRVPKGFVLSGYPKIREAPYETCVF